jgi:hypothetical protein
MNESELGGFETELRRMKTARPPEEFMARLTSLNPASKAPCEKPSRAAGRSQTGVWLLRWLAPVAAVLVVVWFSGQWAPPTGKNSSQPIPISAQADADSDGMEVERRLVSEYDAVAQMPGGEPVRFRCREWSDEIVLRDSASGFVLERSLPHFEIVPVRLETY